MRRIKNDPNVYFDYRDSKMLQRYLDAYGRIEPIARTGLSAKQQRQAPQTGQANHSIDDPADRSGLSTEDPGHQVKFKKADKAPIYRANDG